MSFLDILLHTPIFQGVSKINLTTSIEKYHIEFVKFRAGEKIIEKGESLTHIKFLISGKVLNITPNKPMNLQIKEVFSAPNVIAGNYMFGLETNSIFEVIAQTEVGIMQIVKEDFLDLLRKDSIFMINYLNYISSRSQSYFNTVLSLSTGALKERFAMWVLLLTQKKAEEIVLVVKLSEVAKLMGDTSDNLQEVLLELKQNRFISFTESEIKVLNRHALADLVHDDDLA